MNRKRLEKERNKLRKLMGRLDKPEPKPEVLYSSTLSDAPEAQAESEPDKEYDFTVGLPSYSTICRSYHTLYNA